MNNTDKEYEEFFGIPDETMQAVNADKESVDVHAVLKNGVVGEMILDDELDVAILEINAEHNEEILRAGKKHYVDNYEAVASNGYPIVPTVHREKYPRINNWQDKNFNNQVPNKNSNDGMGIKTKNTPVIDMDVKHEKAARLVEIEIRKLLKKKGKGKILKRIGLAPKFAVPCKLVGDYFRKKSTPVFTENHEEEGGKGGVRHQIEILADGQQFIAFGIHPGTGKDYKWKDDKSPATVPRDDLVEIDEGLADEIIKVSTEVLRKEAKKYGWVEAVHSAKKKTVSRSVANGVSTVTEFEKNIAKIHSALKAVPASKSSYNGWALKTGAALYHASSGSDEVLETWLKWSAEDVARFNEEEMRAKWLTFASYPGKKAGLGSFFDEFFKGGWDGSYRQDKETYLLALRERMAIFDDFNIHHAFINADGRTCVITRIEDSLGGLKTVMTPVSNARDEYRNQFVPMPEKKRTKDGIDRYLIGRRPLFDYWMEHCNRNQYKSLEFKPIAGQVAGGTVLPPGDIYNIYCGLAFEPVEAPVEKFNLILKHILNVICCGNAEAYEYLLNWFAYLMQYPDRQGGAVPVFRSGEGCGKNIIVDMFLRAFGQAGTQLTSQNDLTGQFNDFLALCAFVHLNESVFGGSHVSQGRLKSMISDDIISVEKKYSSRFVIKNSISIIISTNSDWAAPVGIDDRRYVNFDLDETHKGDEAYFNALAAQTHGEGQAAFLYFLLHRDIKGFNPTNVPQSLNRQSVTRLDNKIRTADSVVQWWFDILIEGDILHDGAISTQVIVGDWFSGSVTADVNLIYEAYTNWCKRAKVRRDVEQKPMFSKKLKAMVKKLTKSRPRSNNGQRLHIYKLPGLEDCRSEFSDEFLKQDITW